MQSYLVETYVPKALALDAAGAGRRAREAARELSDEGAAVLYVRTTLLPGDETCFHLFVADSEETVALACRRAGIGSPRIVPALECTRRRHSSAGGPTPRAGGYSPHEPPTSSASV